MKTLVKRLLLLLLVALPLLPAAAFDATKVTIVTAAGERHRFDVELAVTEQDKAQGLMFRETLGENEGMLFINEPERLMVMWMKNTLVSLDMLFLARDGTIVSIARDAVPMSETQIPSGVPVRGVLEVPGGTAARLGLAVGDRVRHALLVP